LFDQAESPEDSLQPFTLMSNALALPRPRLVSRRTWKARKPIFSNRFRFPGQWFFYGRARLYADRVDLKGWGLRGRYVRSIPLSTIERVEWWTGSMMCNLEFCLGGDKTLGIWVEGAGRWKFAIDSQAVQTLHRAPAMPDGMQAVAA
jgi:hypothetical protein